ncbi:hypothetical protein FOMG_04114 [Fusarium oxysporum f. sp. melonis 26406]|uniref:Uncharacterized protein n=4 Tax=Fusarium oxysporum TaxID=5507 RepID=W9JC56_FUSOX|nr:hypothetical protein FOYG_01697 [Fusarium oxysporum NRRL 32931]EXK45845.1 hypothetical protein FOMG_04114 [Fusarium oxysporum f. sp. melonis 26406]EXM34010.1 hypothetical protein FOTG_02467 [Fusarium oxysporum f. sp. vasinfectum 25433]SCO82270.1 uncharacterized protein FRV6_06483 [Fusarium oxysporum]
MIAYGYVREYSVSRSTSDLESTSMACSPSSKD